MKKSLLLLILLTLSSVASAQKSYIKIKLIDAKTGLAVEGAGYSIEGSENGATSNKGGMCFISFQDSAKVEINHIKYQTKIVTLTPAGINEPIKLNYNEFEIERQKNVKNDNRSLLKTLDNKRFIKGKVIDAETGEGMEDATILICGTNIGAISNAKGEFSIPHWYKNNVIVIEITYLSKMTQIVKINAKYKTITLPNPIKLASTVTIM